MGCVVIDLVATRTFTGTAAGATVSNLDNRIWQDKTGN